MKYELNKVVHMLPKHLLPASLLQKKNPEKYLRTITARIISHTQALQREMSDDALFFRMTKEQRMASSKDVPELIHRLNFLQRDTTRALNVLFKIVWTTHAEEYDALDQPLRRCYYDIFCGLRALLLQAHKDYHAFWNHDGLLPHFYRRNRWREAKRAVRNISTLLKEQDAPDGLVIRLVNLPAQIFVPGVRLTYQKLHELEGYRLKSRVAWHELGRGSSSIMSIFFWLPIPSRHLLEDYSDTAKHFADQLETPQQQLGFYTRQVQHTGDALLLLTQNHDDRWPPVMAQINTWLSGHIDYLQKAIASGWTEPAPATTDNIIPDKLRLNLTSHELALLLRFSIEARLIEHTNFNELSRLLIPYVKSFDADVQFESLRTQRKNLNEKVIGKLEDKLQELLRRMAKGKREG